MALTRSDDVGTSSTVLATLSTTGALLFAGWDRKTFKDGVYTSSAFDSDVVALTLAHGLPAIVPSLAYTMLRADAGADAFTLQRRRPYTEFADLQAWQRQEARAQSNFRGSSDHSLVASDDSLFLAVRAPEACASTDSYIARTRRSVP